MKLPILLTTLLLSAFPAFADNFLYLKCETTAQWKQIKPVPEKGERELVLYYKVDLKNKLLTDSAYSDDPPQKVKIQNGVIIEEVEERDDENMLTEVRSTLIAFDPPGTIEGSGYMKTDDNSFEYTAEIEGSCKASNKSVYEANQ